MRHSSFDRDLSKSILYESVKTLLETDDPHIHLNQQKLYTLFSIAFQYFLYTASNVPGCYILRIEDSMLAEKLIRKAKDPTTRKFLQAIILPRKLKYHQSTFYLDFFHFGSWNLTNELPPEKIKGALIVKNSDSAPLAEIDEEEAAILATMPKDYYYSSLKNVAPKTIIIAREETYEDTKIVEFPFIEKEKEKIAHGVTISKDIDLSKIN